MSLFADRLFAGLEPTQQLGHDLCPNVVSLCSRWGVWVVDG